MAIITTLLYPWTVLVQRGGGVPRVLADDISALVGTDQSLEEAEVQARYVEVCEVSGRFLRDMGARVSAPKCFALATTSAL
eukprot:12852292-Alexandrium_andersonii.AAC.1